MSALSIFTSASVKGMGGVEYPLGKWPGELEKNLKQTLQDNIKGEETLTAYYKLCAQLVNEATAPKDLNELQPKRKITTELNLIQRALRAESYIHSALTPVLEQVTKCEETAKITKIGVILYIFKFSSKVCRTEIISRILLEAKKKLRQNYKTTYKRKPPRLNESKAHKLDKKALSRLAAELIVIASEKGCYKNPLFEKERTRSKATPRAQLPVQQDVDREQIVRDGVDYMQHKRKIKEIPELDEHMRERIADSSYLNILGQLVYSEKNKFDSNNKQKLADLKLLMQHVSRPCLLDLGQALISPAIWKKYLINLSSSDSEVTSALATVREMFCENVSTVLEEEWG